MRVKKLSTITIFFVGVIVVATLILTRNFFKTNIANGETNQNLVVYADQLSSQVVNWSWGSSVNFLNKSPVFSGNNSISFIPSAWGGLYFHENTPILTNSYTSLQFAMLTNDSPNNFTMLFYNENNQEVKSVKLSQYPTENQHGWLIYNIPTAIMPSSLSGFALQESSGNAGPITFLDDIQFMPHATLVPSTNQSVLLYTDSLALGWINWSWNSNVSFNITNPVYRGSSAISFTPTAGFGGFYIHSDQGIDTTPYQALTFAAQANASGQTYAVSIYDTNNQMVHSPISLDKYGGQPSEGFWKIYTIPLSDVNASKQTIKGFMIQDTSGKSGQTLFIDQIGFSGNTSILTTNPTPSINSNSSTSPTYAVKLSATSGNPLSTMPFFNDNDTNPALQQEQQWQLSNPSDAAEMVKIANQPKAIWMGSWNNNIQTDVQNIVTQAAKVKSMPVLVAYNIPKRDCGSYSAGGSGSVQTYETWIADFAQGIGQYKATVILEPDALAQITCLSSSDQTQRYQILSYAVQKLKALGHTAVYIDAGNASWIGASDMATRLKRAGIDQADGFALNVSNFISTPTSISYGQQLSQLVGGKHFVIDTSRNGNGPAPDGAWCNPTGRALGEKPTAQTGNSLVDAYLWIKYPGESDGTCNGGPAAGVWYPDYALGLAQRVSW